MFLNYIIFMLLVHLLISYIIFTLRNVKYQFNFCSIIIIVFQYST